MEQETDDNDTLGRKVQDLRRDIDARLARLRNEDRAAERLRDKINEERRRGVAPTQDCSGSGSVFAPATRAPGGR
jgi:hypothetical protein